jgi:hypothetical protein
MKTLCIVTAYVQYYTFSFMAANWLFAAINKTLKNPKGSLISSKIEEVYFFFTRYKGHAMSIFT